MIFLSRVSANLGEFIHPLFYLFACHSSDPSSTRLNLASNKMTWQATVLTLRDSLLTFRQGQKEDFWSVLLILLVAALLWIAIKFCYC